jgi:hypothetical protein
MLRRSDFTDLEGAAVESVLLALALLACPVGMGAMMWFMAKGLRQDAQGSHGEASIEEMRAEHRRLGQEIEQLERPPIDAGPSGAR